MNYFLKHWKGELSLGYAFWLGNLPVAFLKTLFVVLFSAVAAQNNNMKFTEFYSTYGEHGFIILGPLYAIVIYCVVDLATYAWWSVGVMRSCIHSPPTFWRGAAKFFVILGGISVLVSFTIRVIIFSGRLHDIINGS